MNTSQLNEYIKRTELMIEPEQVAVINRASNMLRKLPKGVQNYLARNGAKKNPYMGFVVEPYSSFLAYEILDLERAARHLPAGYRIVPVSMFQDGKERPALILGAFNVHTSVFWGSRVELYMIAENLKNGLMSWIIVDYETNTNSYDPGSGFTAPTTSRSVVTTSWRGEVIVDVESKKSANRLAYVANLQGASNRVLHQRLWVEGNLSVDYGGDLEGGSSQPFGLIFDPGEMSRALSIDSQNLRIERNTMVGDWAAAEPFEAACFPFAQHFITTSMPADIGLADAGELEAAALRLGGPAASELRSAG